jgi:plastocyanin
MKATFYAGSIAVVAMIILIIASISAPALLFTQTAIASIDQGETTTATTDPTQTAPDNATQRVAVGGGNITFSVNQFSPQITEIQPGGSVTFFAPEGSIEFHNVIFDLTNGTTLSDLWLPFILPPDVSTEALQLAPPYNLGEPMIQNMTTTTDGAAQAIEGLNKVAWQPAVVDQNGNVIYLEEEELRQQMRQVDEAFLGGPQPSPLSTSYTMDGSERIVSSGIVLDVNGYAILEELFPEEEAPQDELAAEDNQEIATNSTTTTITTPPSSPDDEAVAQQEEQPVEEFPPTPFPLLGSFTVTFSQPGTYEYFCAFHPGMFGIVTVAEGEGEGEEEEEANMTVTADATNTNATTTEAAAAAAEQEGEEEQQQQTGPTIQAPNPLFE